MVGDVLRWDRCAHDIVTSIFGSVLKENTRDVVETEVLDIAPARSWWSIAGAVGHAEYVQVEVDNVDPHQHLGPVTSAGRYFAVPPVIAVDTHLFIVFTREPKDPVFLCEVVVDERAPPFCGI